MGKLIALPGAEQVTWLNLGTVQVRMDLVALIKKVNVERLASGESGERVAVMLEGIEIHLINHAIVEMDYLVPGQRDQVYDALWAEIKDRE